MSNQTYPKSVQAGIPRLGLLKPGYKRISFSDILYEERRPIKLEDESLYRLITIKRSRGGIVEREIMEGKKISVQSQFEIVDGDFVISKRQIVHGACALVSKEFNNCIVSNEYSVLKAKPNLNIEYLKYLSHSVYFQQTCFHSSIGVHIEKMIFKLQDWFKIKIDIPPIKEQEKIVSFLSSVDTKIEQLTSKVKLLQEYKKGVMQKIFSQEIRFRADDGSEYPEWVEKKLGGIEDNGIIKMSRGSVISKKDIAEYSGNYPIYSSSVKNNGLFGHYSKYMFDEELITWSVDGGGHFFYRPKHRFSITNVSGYIRILDGSINYQFLALQLQQLHKRITFDYQTKAHPSVIRKLYIIQLPSMQEQIKIANFLSSIDSKIEQAQKQLDSTKEFKKALLQQMFV